MLIGNKTIVCKHCGFMYDTPIEFCCPRCKLTEDSKEVSKEEIERRVKTFYDNFFGKNNVN